MFLLSKPGACLYQHEASGKLGTSRRGSGETFQLLGLTQRSCTPRVPAAAGTGPARNPVVVFVARLLVLHLTQLGFYLGEALMLKRKREMQQANFVGESLRKSWASEEDITDFLCPYTAWDPAELACWGEKKAFEGLSRFPKAYLHPLLLKSCLWLHRPCPLPLQSSCVDCIVFGQNNRSAGMDRLRGWGSPGLDVWMGH